jgi:APA family basic amino acid/polyamine antiporter
MKPDTPAPHAGLLRALGPLMATAIVVGTVIGSGVFKKPQEVAQNVPYTGLAALAWILGGLLALLGGLAYAEVAVLYPRAGGNYVFLREAYGRLAGFLWGWVEFWIIRAASLAALATIFTESLHAVFRESLGAAATDQVLGFWSQRWLTVAVILGLGGVNVLGVRWGGLLQLFITTVKVGSLVAIAALPFVALAVGGWTMTTAMPRAANLVPAWPAASALDFGAFGSALLAVLWAYHGWMNIGPVAEEVKNPQRNIPLALLGGGVIIIALYLSANLAYALVIPQDEMAQMKEPDPSAPVEVVDRTVAIGFSRRLLGPVGVGAAAAAVMCSVFGALNGNLLVGPRLLYAMGEDGLAPRALGAVHPRFHTPALAILVMALWAAVLILAAGAIARYGLPVFSLGGWTFDLNPRKGKPLFDILTDFAMFGAVTFETLAVATIFVFRRRRPHANRPYRCWGYPAVPVLYVIILALVLANMFVHQRIEALVGVGFIGLGALVYLLMFGGRPRSVEDQNKALLQ